MNNQITNWKKREGQIKESIWLNKGIELYREQLYQNPNDPDCKINLAKLLVRSGTDEKIRYTNLMKAQQLFEEVLAIFPNDADALYRLGHIHYQNKEYEKCIEYFKRAMVQTISEIRLFRSISTISKAFYYIGYEEMAYKSLQKAIELDKERNFTKDINEIQSLITENGQFKRFVRYSDGTHQFISLEDAKKLKAETANDDEAELDLSHHHPTFTGPEGDTRLERKEAEILLYLIERDRTTVSKEELLNVWEEDDAPEESTIKSYISKIRRKLENCFTDGVQVIETVRGEGYRWSRDIPAKVIKVL